jgi:outer membrane protein
MMNKWGWKLMPKFSNTATPMSTAAPAGRTPWIAMLATMLLTALIAAAPASAANLQAIYALALANDAQYAAAVAAAAAGREKGAQGRALLRPTVGISASARRNNDSSSAYEGNANYRSGSASLTLTQPLLRQANVAGHEHGELQALLAEQQLKLAEQDLLLRVSRGYFDVLQARDALLTLGAQREAFASQLAQAKRGLDVGVARVTDLNEAQSRFDLAVAQEIAARNEVEVKRRVLERVIGRALPPLATLASDATTDVLSAQQLAELVTAAPQNSLQVASNATAVQIASLELTRQEAGHIPTVDLVAAAGSSRNANFTTTAGGQQLHTASLGIEVAIPLYQGGAISSRAREAAAGLSRAQSELENARRQATFDANQAMLGVQSGNALNLALIQALKSSETQVRSTQRGLEVGVRTRVDVLNAEQQLFTTRRDLAAARYQTLVSGLQLKAAAGMLSEQDLKKLDALLRE